MFLFLRKRGVAGEKWCRGWLQLSVLAFMQNAFCKCNSNLINGFLFELKIQLHLEASHSVALAITQNMQIKPHQKHELPMLCGGKWCARLYGCLCVCICMLAAYA